MDLQFRSGAVGQRRATGPRRRLRAVPETEDLLRGDAARLGAVLARTRRSMVPAPSRLGAGISRLPAAEGTTEPLRAQPRLFQRAIRAGRGGGAPACRHR